MRTTFRLFLLVTLLLSGFGFAPAGPAQAETPYPPCLDGSTQLTGIFRRWCAVVHLRAIRPGLERHPGDLRPRLRIPRRSGKLESSDDAHLREPDQSGGWDLPAVSAREPGLRFWRDDLPADGPGGCRRRTGCGRRGGSRACRAGPVSCAIYVAGVSEGGLVTTLATEQRPDLFAGGLATCGPIGDFQKQIDYFGDFRVLYDYFFPDILPGNATNIPTALVKDWPDKFQPRALDALSQNPGNALQLIFDLSGGVRPVRARDNRRHHIGSIVVQRLLHDECERGVGGQPIRQQEPCVLPARLTTTALNLGVRRYTASPTALANVGAYQTTGQLAKPLVTLHTTLDPVVPFWHEAMYGARRWQPKPELHDPSRWSATATATLPARRSWAPSASS